MMNMINYFTNDIPENMFGEISFEKRESCLMCIMIMSLQVHNKHKSAIYSFTPPGTYQIDDMQISSKTEMNVTGALNGTEH